ANLISSAADPAAAARANTGAFPRADSSSDSVAGGGNAHARKRIPEVRRVDIRHLGSHDGRVHRELRIVLRADRRNERLRRDLGKLSFRYRRFLRTAAPALGLLGLGFGLQRLQVGSEK